MLGNLTFDHIWQALYFLGCGFILSEVVSVMRPPPSGEHDVGSSRSAAESSGRSARGGPRDLVPELSRHINSQRT
jgi:hypothetical protein